MYRPGGTGFNTRGIGAMPARNGPEILGYLPVTYHGADLIYPDQLRPFRMTKGWFCGIRRQIMLQLTGYYT